MEKVLEAQKRASRKWELKNRSRRQYINKRSATKSFIKNDATNEDLDEVQALLRNRKKEL